LYHIHYLECVYDTKSDEVHFFDIVIVVLYHSLTFCVFSFKFMLQHIDVVLYYLRKKSKLRSPNEYRFTTVNCLFKTFINEAYNRYYCSAFDDNLTTQEHMARGAVISAIERSIKNIIKGFSIPAGLPWHLVDEVYIPVNSDGEFHWVLAIVVLKERLIHVYDSSMGTRVREPCGEIEKLATMLSSFLHDSDFFDQTERTN